MRYLLHFKRRRKIFYFFFYQTCTICINNLDFFFPSRLHWFFFHCVKSMTQYESHSSTPLIPEDELTDKEKPGSVWRRHVKPREVQLNAETKQTRRSCWFVENVLLLTACWQPQTHTHTHTYIHTHVYINTHTYIHIYPYTHIPHTYIHYIYVCMYINTHTFILAYELIASEISI